MGFKDVACGVASIYMGFKRGWHDLLVICIGFKMVVLKTHANTSKSLLKPLKTHVFHS